MTAAESLLKQHRNLERRIFALAAECGPMGAVCAKQALLDAVNAARKDRTETERAMAGDPRFHAPAGE